MSDTTVWSTSVNTSVPANPVAGLTVSMNGGAATSVALKGVCYSPCPLNGSNSYGPNIGDWFWDSYSGTGYSITGWSALWARDLPNIRALGANTLRVYSMLSRQLNDDGTFPSPWNSGHLFTHTAFLDECWNGGVDPIYVLAGIPLPQAMFWLSIYQTTPQSQIEFWKNVLQETVAQMADHPAVIGFIIQNEQDSGTVTYGSDTEAVDFWWGQVEHMAKIAKTAAPNKLVGMAVHDDPNICGQAQSHMAQCPSLDFWGVNTYQTITFQSVFGPVPNVGPGYSGLTGAALKPVILTEYGIPATGHQNPNDASTIYADATTEGNTATVLDNMVPQVYGAPPPSPQQPYPIGLSLGMYYFEFCDEWWNQGGSPNIYTWWGGSPSEGFPNKYWDQDGFGIYSISRGTGLSNDAPIWGNNGPNMPIDTQTPRAAIVSSLQNSFAKANPS